MEERGRGRGRGYGRGRGQATDLPGPSQPMRFGAPPARPPSGDRPQGSRPVGPPGQAWPRPASAQPRQPRAQVSAPPQAGSDSSSRAHAVHTEEAGDGNGNGNGKRSVRGRFVTKSEILVTRPKTMATKKGTSGRPISLTSNYLTFQYPQNWCLYQYRVDFNPEVDATFKRKSYARTALREIIKGGYLFDGTVLYVPEKLPKEQMELFVKDDNEENVRIDMRLVGDVAWGDYHYINLFNIIMRKLLYLMNYKLVGRNYFCPQNEIIIKEHSMKLWPGYTTSVRQHEERILLNIDLQTKCMRTDTCYDMLMECAAQSRTNVKNDYCSKVVGSVVLTFYNNKTYRIDDVDFNQTPNDTFALKDESRVSYKDYYEKKYQIKIKHMDQPLLISRSKPREIRAGMPETVILIPELCEMTGLTDRQRENFQLMKALAEHTRINPDERVRRLVTFATQIVKNKECMDEVNRWNVKIGNELVKISGRVLDTEKILVNRGSQVVSYQYADWTAGLRSKPMFITGDLPRLAVVCPNRCRSQCENFNKMLKQCAQGFNWNIGTPCIFEINDDRIGTYLDCISNTYTTRSPTMFMVVLNNKTADKYNAIKKKLCVDLGIPSQVVTNRSLTNKGLMSIATKVVIQLNCKLGGAPWSVVIPVTSMMVVGYDVCRDTVKKSKSFSGIVASLDQQMTRYVSYTFEHEQEEELSKNFATHMLLACQKYKEVNGDYPKMIVIYRDGVGDGMIPYVKELEVASIREKLTSQIYNNGRELKMAFVVVSKRIATKFFLNNKDNPPPGTVVDDVVTLPERYDFYIVSQCTRQGTVNPTSYNIIDDTLCLGPDKMQILTYKLTHMYYNWSGTVRVPAPCQYAHKLAFLVSQSLHKSAKSNLSTTLFYL